jgi:sugar lactone lactonase YvrE
MNRKLIYITILLLPVLFIKAQSPRIEFEAPAAYPEGTVYDPPAEVFYVSSVHTGTIGKVDRSGKYTPVYIDSSLKSTFGMKIDPARKRLWVCAGDPNYSQYRDSFTYKKMIRVIQVDLATGKKIADIDMSGLYNGRHFPNDLSLDEQGNAYITDSFSPVIYKIDNTGKASLFTQSSWFSSAGVGLNGIVWHPSGYLLVANNGDGSLLKIDLSDPKHISKVQLDQFFPGADGLLLDGQQNLVIVQNKGVNKIFKLSSTDNWLHAKVIAATQSKDMFSYPSTATLKGSEVWVMNAKLNELSDSSSVFSKKFSLQLAQFVPVK